MSKSSQAFRTIREVAEWLDVKAHVLRFWESKFPQIKPVKRAGGRRYYRPGDMELVGGIKVLLHEQGMTIKGVQDLIRDEGVGHVAGLSQPIDMIDFEEASVDELETWDRELAADAVDPAPLDDTPAEPLTAPDVDDAVVAEAEAPAEEAAPEDAPLVLSEPDSDPAGSAELAEAEGADLLSDLDADPETEASALPESVFADDTPEEVAEADASEEDPVEDDAFVSWDDPDAGMVKKAEPETAAEPEPDSMPALLAESDTQVDAPEAPVAEPLDTPAPANDEPAQDMNVLMADFAQLTARIPALDDDTRAALKPILVRTSELAARMSA